MGQNPQRTFSGRELAFSSQTRKLLKRQHCRKYFVDFNQILHSDSDHEAVFEGGPSVPITNRIWRTAVVLKNRKIAVSWPRLERCRRNLA